MKRQLLAFLLARTGAVAGGISVTNVELSWTEKFGKKLPDSVRDKIERKVEDLRSVLIEASDFLYAMQNAKTESLKWVSFGVRSDVRLPLTSAPENRPVGSVSVDITDDAPNVLFLVWRPASRYTDEGVPKAADLAKGHVWRDGQGEGSPVDSPEKLARWLRFR